MPKLQILSGKRQGTVIDLQDGEVDIGNRKSAKISIRDPWISYNHAKISGQSGRFFIEDMGSSNGTWINGEKIKRHELTTNSVIYLGKTKVKFVSMGGPDATATAQPAPINQQQAPQDGSTPWWDRVLDGDEKAPSKARVNRIEAELQEERQMRKALEKFLDLPRGAQLGDAAQAGALAKEVKKLEAQVRTLKEAGGGDGDGAGGAEAVQKALEEERAATEESRREHMSKLVELEGKVAHAESQSVDLERRLKEKNEQVKKEVSRAKEKMQSEMDELKSSLEEARKSATELASGGDGALSAERERGDKLERDLEEWRDKARQLEEKAESLETDLEEAKQAKPAEGGEEDGEGADTLKSQLWAAVEEATKWKDEARRSADEVEEARAEADKWREEHAKIVQEIDEISMEQIDVEDELNAKVKDLEERIASYEGGDSDDPGDDSDDDD